MGSPDYAATDFFRDKDLFQDPHAYYEWVRAQGRCWHGPKRGVVFVSGFDEAVAVYRDHERFSSCNTVAGPFFPWPVPLEGDDISAIIAEHRDALPFSDQLPVVRPAEAHRPARAPHAAHHTEAPQGERGVHVAPRRPGLRRVPRPG